MLVEYQENIKVVEIAAWCKSLDTLPISGCKVVSV